MLFVANNLIMLSVNYAECRKKFHYAEGCYAECHYAECHYAECHYAECHYAECHYAECRYAECRGVIFATSLSRNESNSNFQPVFLLLR